MSDRRMASLARRRQAFPIVADNAFEGTSTPSRSLFREIKRICVLAIEESATPTRRR